MKIPVMDYTTQAGFKSLLIDFYSTGKTIHKETEALQYGFISSYI